MDFPWSNLAEAKEIKQEFKCLREDQQDGPSEILAHMAKHGVPTMDGMHTLLREGNARMLTKAKQYFYELEPKSREERQCVVDIAGITNWSFPWTKWDHPATFQGYPQKIHLWIAACTDDPWIDIRNLGLSAADVLASDIEVMPRNVELHAKNMNLLSWNLYLDESYAKAKYVSAERIYIRASGLLEILYDVYWPDVSPLAIPVFVQNDTRTIDTANFLSILHVIEVASCPRLENLYKHTLHEFLPFRYHNRLLVQHKNFAGTQGYGWQMAYFEKAKDFYVVTHTHALCNDQGVPKVQPPKIVEWRRRIRQKVQAYTA